MINVGAVLLALYVTAKNIKISYTCSYVTVFAA